MGSCSARFDAIGWVGSIGQFMCFCYDQLVRYGWITTVWLDRFGPLQWGRVLGYGVVSRFDWLRLIRIIDGCATVEQDPGPLGR